jgi:F-type H+-transporting ATPase subunit b
MAQSAQSAPSETTTQAQVGQDGGAHSNFPPFDPSTFPSQLVWFAIAFGFLYWYMSKRGLPQLGAVIDGRKARIARDLDDATAMQQKADAAAAAHERTLAEAHAKAQSLAQAARDAAAADAQGKRKALEDELAAKLAGAEREIARMRADAMANVAEVARDAAGAIVERLGGRPADPASIAAAVNSAKSLSGAA